MFYLAGLHPSLLFLLVVGSTIGISILGLVLSRKYLPHPLLVREEVRTAIAICTIIGGLFGLLLALVVVSVWQDFKSQNEMLIEEAVSISILYRDSSGFDTGFRDSLRQAIREYNEKIITDAWPKMKEGIESEATWLAFNKMYRVALRHPAKDEEELAFKRNMLQQLNNLATYRRQRLFYATNTVIQEGLWVVLISGAAISIVSTYFFKIGSLKTQTMLSVLHSGIIGITLFLAIALMYPYRSGLRLQPDPFVKLKTQVFPLIDSVYNFNNKMGFQKMQN
ncbi:MAG: hypothetical protein ACK40G_04510 [Cytophagaceae bacterium]